MALPSVSSSFLILILSFFMLFSSPTFISIARAQGRAPHGLVYETPVAFSPSAVEFFHPKTLFHPKTQDPLVLKPCQESSGCSPLPMAAQVAQESKMSSPRSNTDGGSNGLGAGGIAGIVFGVSFVVFLTMGVYYVVRTRRANLSKDQNSVVQPEA